ncbi:MAG TPA: GNAT family N-acetyltransferase [Polyangiaceae bacterium]|nr:GNAT family N-acetyltransferase [Polyangiaceae bacterium]
MSIAIRRLGPGDEATLELLSKEDADFDLEGRSDALPPLKPAMAQRYLANPSVLHWVAVKDGVVIGFLYCAHLLLRTEPGQELLLYEIGVRKAHRRQGVGRALLDHMARWMQSNGISVVWVCADNRIAVDFYRGCGFSSEQPQPLYMTRAIEPAPKSAARTLLSVG